MTNIKQDNVRLQSRIVADPQKLLQTIQDMQKSVKNYKQNVMMAERKLRELKSRFEAMSVIEQDLEDALQLLNEAQEQRDKAREAEKSLAGLKEGFKRKENQLKDMEMKEQVFRYLC